MPTLAELYGQPQETKREPTLAELYGSPEPATATPEPKAQPTLAELYGTPEPPTPRKPADDDGQRHGWNLMDTVIAGAPAVADAWQNMVPGLNQAVITDYEAAPNANRGGWWGKAVDTVSDIGSSVVSGAAGAALGGPIGMGITGAADQLGRNFEDKIIEGARERMAANPELTKQEAADQAFRAGEGKLDAGDYAESALSGVFAYGGGKVGEKAFRKVAESGFPTVRRLVQGSAAPVAYDAVTGGLQGAASVLNRENVDSVSGAADALTDPNNLKQIATGAAIGAGMSVGGQTAQGIGFYKRGNSPGISPAREAELQTDLQGEVDALRMEGQARAEARAQREQAAANAAERQRIADVETRAAQTRDLVEAERAETNRVQEEQSIREARRNIEAARQQALREAQEAEAAFRENPTMENAQARVAAIDRANELANVPDVDAGLPQTQPEQPRLALPMPEGMTAGEFPGRMINPTKGGDPNGLQQREEQGQTSRRPFGLGLFGRKSQAIEATPPTAGEGVINQRGEQIELPGEPVKRGMGMNALRRGSLERGQQDSPEVKAFHADPDYKQVRDAIVLTGDKTQKGKTLSERMDLLKTEVFDEFRPIQKAEQAREKITGEKLKALDSPYKTYRNLNRSIISKVNKAIETGVTDWDSGKAVSPSVMDVVAPVYDRLNDFEILLAARRTPEMAKRQDVLPFDADAASRLTKKLESMPEMRNALKGYDAIIDAQLDNMVKSGFKTADEVAAMRKENTLYAPWERVDDDGNIRLSVNPAPGRRIDQPRDPLQRVTKKGSKKQIASPLETSIKNIVQMQAAMEKNAAKRTLVDTIGSVPGLEDFSRKLTEADVKGMDDSKYIVVRREGVKEYHQVNPEIKKTLDGLAPEESDLLDKTLTGLAQFFRGSVTLDPPFAINNLLRDGLQQAVISRSGLGLPMENQIRGLGMLATKRGRNEWKEWKESAANQAIQYGAITSQRDLIIDMQRRAGTSRNTLFSKDLIDPRNWHKVVTKPLGSGVRGLNKVMQVAESLGRVGEYGRVKKQSLKKGFTEAEARAEAEFESADLGDFGMTGRSKKVKNLRRWISFFGAAMSFNYREIGALKSPKVLLKATALYGGMELLNFYMNQDDPEYWNLPDDQRRRYWHYKNEEGKFIALPKPVGIISYLFSEPVRFLADRFIAGETETGIKELADGLFESVLPPEAPQFLKTGAELMIGDDGYSFFYDRPIVSQGLSRLPKELQYTDRTSLAARGISEGLSNMGLGSYSPQKIDYFIGSGMGPGVRRLVETGVDPLISKATGQRVPGQSLGVSLTKRNIFFPEDKGSEAVDRFYSKLETMEQAAAADKLGDPHGDYSKHELRQMRRKADKLSEQRKLLKKYVGDDKKQREIKQRMVKIVRSSVDEIMPDRFAAYEPKLPGEPVN